MVVWVRTKLACAITNRDRLTDHIHAYRLSLNEACPFQETSDGINHMTRVNRAGGNLRQHGSKEEEVVGADQRHLGSILQAQLALECLRRRDAAESASEDHNAAVTLSVRKGSPNHVVPPSHAARSC